MSKLAIGPPCPLDVLSDDMLASVLKVVGTLDNTTLWRDVPRVSRRWATVCQTRSLGVDMVFQITYTCGSGHNNCHCPGGGGVRVSRHALPPIIPLMRAERTVALMGQIKAAAQRHYHPRSTIVVVKGVRYTDVICRIAELGADWINGLVISAPTTEGNASPPTTKPDQECVAHVMDHCPNLVHLGFAHRDCDITERAPPTGADNALLARLCARYPRMQTLDIDGWDVTSTSDGLGCLAACPMLTAVRMRVVDYPTDEIVARIISSCPQLRLDNMVYSNKGDLAHAADALSLGPRKKQWLMNPTDKLSIHGAQAMLEACPNIEYAEIWPWEGSAVLGLVAMHCRHLKRLDLRYIYADLLSVMRDCKELEHVQLHGCGSLTSAVLEGMATTCGPRLRTLSLAELPNEVTAEALGKLLKSCTSLKHLTLRQCGHQLTLNVCEFVLGPAVRRLETLTVKYAGVVNVMKMLKHNENTLRRLDFVGDRGMTWEQLQHLTRMCPALTHLRVGSRSPRIVDVAHLLLRELTCLLELCVTHRKGRAAWVSFGASGSFEVTVVDGNDDADAKPEEADADTTTEQFAECYPNLRKLQLEETSSVTRNGAKRIMSRIPHLDVFHPFRDLDRPAQYDAVRDPTHVGRYRT
jgi:hypothetical protein